MSEQKVYIHNLGLSVFGKLDLDLWQIIDMAMKDATLKYPLDIPAMVIGNQASGALTQEGLLAGKACWRYCPDARIAQHINAGSASGAAALQQGFLLIRHGIANQVLVIAAEKMSQGPNTATISRIISDVLDQQEYKLGLTMVHAAAQIAKFLLKEYGHTSEDWARVAVKNHDNGYYNPIAHLRRKINLYQAQTSKIIADPLRLYDCSPISDGAAVILLSAQPSTLEIIASESAVTAIALDQRQDLGSFKATQLAATRAYKTSGVTPEEIELAEIHDAFTPFELLGIESALLCKKNEAVGNLKRGYYHRDSALPVNASGGLKSRGHPVGASGLAQVVELAKMLLGIGVFDFSHKRLALSMSIGGLASQNYVSIINKI